MKIYVGIIFSSLAMTNVRPFVFQLSSPGRPHESLSLLKLHNLSFSGANICYWDVNTNHIFLPRNFSCIQYFSHSFDQIYLSCALRGTYIVQYCSCVAQENAFLYLYLWLFVNVTFQFQSHDRCLKIQTWYWKMPLMSLDASVRKWILTLSSTVLYLLTMLFSYKKVVSSVLGILFLRGAQLRCPNVVHFPSWVVSQESSIVNTEWIK